GVSGMGGASGAAGAGGKAGAGGAGGAGGVGVACTTSATCPNGFACDGIRCRAACASRADCQDLYVCGADTRCHMVAYDIPAGAGHPCVSLYDGRVYCWGKNNAHQAGASDAGHLTAPTQVSVPGILFNTIVAAGDTTCAADSFGEVYCWGDGSF